MARPRKFKQDDALEKAMHVFWQKGYEATSLDDLTAAMGIKRQSVYNSFGDKHALYMQSLERYRAARRASMREYLTGQGTLKEGFRRLFNHIVNDAVEDPEHKGCMVVNAMAELAGADPQVRKLVETAETENETVFAEVIEAAQAKGELSRDKNSKALAAFLYNGVIGLRVRARKNVDKSTLVQIVEVTLAVLE